MPDAMFFPSDLSCSLSDSKKDKGEGGLLICGGKERPYTIIWFFTKQVNNTNIPSSNTVMAENNMDFVALLIDEKLKLQPQTPPQFCIFKVPNHLRRVNETAYEPEIVSIGPYHRGRTHLKPMEDHKLYYLRLLLQRRSESNVDKYAKELRALEKKARSCYELESVSHFGEDGFVEMLLLDGIFVLEVMRKERDMEKEDDDKYQEDPVFRMANVFKLKKDLLLVENQIPFFVLLKLFEMTAIEFEEEITFMDMAFEFFADLLRGPGLRGDLPEEKIQHLVGFMHDQWLPPHDPKIACENIIFTGTRNYISMPCATELEEAGIEFQKVEEGNMFDIKFERGVIKMPTLLIDNSTEYAFRNFIAYEQFSCRSQESPNHVTDYAFFLDCLINSPNDVELLCRKGIIVRPLGDNEMVATLVNKLCQNTTMVLGGSIYWNVYDKVNKHCSRRLNAWMANLRHDYFHSPWAFISLLAAIFLLVLSFIQSFCSVYPCEKK